MGTATKTFKENTYSTQQATWTVSVTHADMTVSASTFKFTAPTASAKYVYSGRDQAHALFVFRFGGVGSSVTDEGEFHTGNDSFVSLASNTAKSLTYKDYGLITDSISTSLLFNSSNKTSKSVPIYVHTSRIDLESRKYNTTNENSYHAYYEDIGPVFNLTLNAPPTVTLGTPTYATPHYAGFGAYTVPLTKLTAQYGGDIKSAKLTVGSQSTTKTYSANTVSNDTISVVPTTAGTFTPTLIVTDSRGQTTTKTLSSITVNQYVAPSVSFDVFRTDNVGVRDDEGTYGLITAIIKYTSAVANLQQPAVTIDGTATSNVTWYSSYNSTTGVSSAISNWSSISSGATVYGLINGSFGTTQSYIIGMTETDTQSGASQTVTQTLSTAFYTIDIQAGGKEIVFGGAAKDDVTNHPNGLFKCEMDVIGRGFLDYFYPVGSYYETSDTTFNPNTRWGGTWVLETEGKVHVSAGTNYTAGDTGGSATHKHTTGNFTLGTTHIPAHTHGEESLSGYLTLRRYGTTANAGHITTGNSGIVSTTTRSGMSGANGVTGNSVASTTHTQVTVNATHTHNSVGGGSAHNHGDTGPSSTMQPYIVVNRWHRTA